MWSKLSDWSAEPGITDSCFGWAALAPLAMAWFVLRAEIPIDVESDYLSHARERSSIWHLPAWRRYDLGHDDIDHVRITEIEAAAFIESLAEHPVDAS